jgi:hypothetical protein
MRPDELLEAFLADGKLREYGDKVPRFAEQRLVALTLGFESVLARKLHKAGDVRVLIEGLGFGVKLDEEIKIFWEAAGVDAEAACICWRKNVGTGAGWDTCEVALYTGEELFDHSEVAGTEGEVVDMDAVMRVRYPVPDSVVSPQFAIARTGSLLVGDSGESVQ